MTDPASPDMPIALASTVLVLRDAAAGLEVLMMRRASELVFHGGAWVFPGGRVDPGDFGEGDELATARRAGVRETREESGLILRPEQLVPVSHWTTPAGKPRRFATWFFAAALSAAGAAVDIVVDGLEIDAHRWLRPEDALRDRARGGLELPAPTFVTLSLLCEFSSSVEALAFFRAAQPPFYVPKLHPVPDGLLSIYHDDAAYDGGPLDQPGPRHRLHMLEGGWRYERSG